MVATGSMTTAKNDVFIFFIGLNLLLVGREQKFGEDRGVGGEGMRKFLAGEGKLPLSPQWGKPCIYIYIYIYI